jgi:hypothetical protein
MEEVTTEDIELTGRREDFNVRVRLQRPDPLVTFLGGDVVEFRGIVEEAVVLHTFDPVETVVLGLDPQLQLDGQLPSGTVRVQGRQLDLEDTEPDQVQLIVDASAITSPGQYVLSVRPDVPQGLIVLRYEPTEVEVTVRAR